MVEASIIFKRSIFEYVFHGICLLCTLGLTIMCIYEFNLNNDIAQINYKTFHESSDDIYPSITLCIKNPFKLASWNHHRYKSFISGSEQFRPDEMENLINIDYDEVSPQLSSFLTRVQLEFMSFDTTQYEIIRYLVNNESLVLDVVSDHTITNFEQNRGKLKS